MARRTRSGPGPCLCADELRTWGGLPVRLEPRDDHACGPAADGQGGAHEAITQPHAVCARLFFDALRVKIRDEGLVKNKAVYVALAYNGDGEKDVLGLWIEHTEGAKVWLRVINELKARGV